jgi:hypothetical protein
MRRSLRVPDGDDPERPEAHAALPVPDYPGDAVTAVLLRLLDPVLRDQDRHARDLRFRHRDAS